MRGKGGSGNHKLNNDLLLELIMKINKIENNIYEIPKEGKMLVPVKIYAINIR